MKTIDDLIIESLKRLKSIYPDDFSGTSYSTNNSKELLVFPSYFEEDDETKKIIPKALRFSEQEARFMFVATLYELRDHPFHYAIEAPTEEAYRFSSKEKESSMSNPIREGQSALIDV